MQAAPPRSEAAQGRDPHHERRGTAAHGQKMLISILPPDISSGTVRSFLSRMSSRTFHDERLREAVSCLHSCLHCRAAWRSPNPSITGTTRSRRTLSAALTPPPGVSRASTSGRYRAPRVLRHGAPAEPPPQASIRRRAVRCSNLAPSLASSRNIVRPTADLVSPRSAATAANRKRAVIPS